MRPGEAMVTLHDGREVSNYSDEFRHECECVWLLRAKPTRVEKHRHLYGVDDRRMLFEFNTKTGREVLREDHAKLWLRPPLMKHRGLEAADRLLADAKKIYDAQQAS